MKFRPCIDLHNGRVKQIVGSTLVDNRPDVLVTNFESDKPPSWYADLYKKDGLSGGHVIMLGANPANTTAAIEALQAFPLGLQIGGGINPQNAQTFLDAGASHVIVTSYVFSNGTINFDNLEKLKTAVGKNRLVLDLSCKYINDSYIIMTDRWQNPTVVSLSAPLLETLSASCDEFLIHAAHVEGMRQGIDQRLVELLADISPIPVTYAGGIRSMEDVALVKTAGKDTVDFTVGSALDLFGGVLRYRDVVGYCS